jgi:hypothetical protein
MLSFVLENCWFEMLLCFAVLQPVYAALAGL